MRNKRTWKPQGGGWDVGQDWSPFSLFCPIKTLVSTAQANPLGLMSNRAVAVRPLVSEMYLSSSNKREEMNLWQSWGNLAGWDEPGIRWRQHHKLLWTDLLLHCRSWPRDLVTSRNFLPAGSTGLYYQVQEKTNGFGEAEACQELNVTAGDPTLGKTRNAIRHGNFPQVKFWWVIF